MILKRFNLNKQNVNPIRIIVMLGDSLTNGAGTINASTDVDSKYLQTEPNAIIYAKFDRTSTDNGGFQPYIPNIPNWNRSPGYTQPTAYPLGLGYDMGFVSRMRELGKGPYVIIKWSLGGTKLVGNWQKTDNDMYRGLVEYVFKVAMPKLFAMGYRGYVSDVLVTLGTNDAVASSSFNTTTFGNAFRQLFFDLRNDLGCPNAKIRAIQVRSDLSSAPSTTATAASVSGVQSVLASPGITNYSCVDLYQSLPLQSDGVHYTNAGFLTIGEDHANAIA